MKKVALLFVLAILPAVLFSQSTTIILQPGPDEGVDCLLSSLEMYTNFGDYADYVANAWTVNSEPLIMRTLFRFELSDLPNQNFLSATMHLRCNPESTNYQLNSGENSSMIYMVTEPWYEYNTTWSNQPSYRTDIFVETLPVYEEEGDLQNIDMTEIVQYWIDNPDVNFGCILMLAVEEQYSCLVQSSSDHPDPERRPKLVLEFGDCPVLDLDFPVSTEERTVTVSFGTEEIGGVCRWDFGDGTIETGDTVSHTYISAGTYNIAFEYITESCGIYNNEKEVCIYEQSPDYEYYINFNQPNKIAFFPNEGVASVIEWDFGDGTISYEEDPIHEFPGQGIYTVCLHCINQCDVVDTICYDIEILMVGIKPYGITVKSVYPNPANKEVTLNFSESLNADIELFTLSGKIVAGYRCTGKEKMRINVSDLRPGVYIVKVSQEAHQLLFEKLVVY